ncbi:MAG: outer membrane beta-barrel protein [Candidatus Cloacimonadales bacterium]
MRNLKTVFILIVVLLCTQVVVAQIAKPTFIIKGGVSSASLIMEGNNHTQSNIANNRLGFNLGLALEFPISQIMNLETGFFLARKGMKKDENKLELKLSPLYFEFPFNLKLIKSLGDKSFYATAGVYLGYGVAGKKEITDKTGTSLSQHIAWGSGKEDDMVALDLGGGLGIGYIFGKVEAGFYGSTSFTNISPVISEGQNMRNVVLGLMVGYRL